MHRMKAYLAIPLAFAAMACDNEPIDPVTGGEGSGSEGFRVVVTDDPATAGETLQGTVTGTIRVALRNDAGSLVSLGVADDVEIELHEGADTVALEGLSRPPLDDYTAVQLRFEGVVVEVLAGSEVGDSTLAQNVVMDVGTAGNAVVDVLVPVFGVDAASVIEIVVDLNSEGWVTGENLDDALVPQADLVNSVTVDVP